MFRRRGQHGKEASPARRRPSQPDTEGDAGDMWYRKPAPKSSGPSSNADASSSSSSSNQQQTKLRSSSPLTRRAATGVEASPRSAYQKSKVDPSDLFGKASITDLMAAETGGGAADRKESSSSKKPSYNMKTTTKAKNNNNNNMRDASPLRPPVPIGGLPKNSQQISNLSPATRAMPKIRARSPSPMGRKPLAPAGGVQNGRPQAPPPLSSRPGPYPSSSNNNPELSNNKGGSRSASPSPRVQQAQQAGPGSSNAQQRRQHLGVPVNQQLQARPQRPIRGANNHNRPQQEVDRNGIPRQKSAELPISEGFQPSALQRSASSDADQILRSPTATTTQQNRAGVNPFSLKGFQKRQEQYEQKIEAMSPEDDQGRPKLAAPPTETITELNPPLNYGLQQQNPHPMSPRPPPAPPQQQPPQNHVSSTSSNGASPASTSNNSLGHQLVDQMNGNIQSLNDRIRKQMSSLEDKNSRLHDMDRQLYDISQRESDQAKRLQNSKAGVRQQEIMLKTKRDNVEQLKKKLRDLQRELEQEQQAVSEAEQSLESHKKSTSESEEALRKLSDEQGELAALREALVDEREIVNREVANCESELKSLEAIQALARGEAMD